MTDETKLVPCSLCCGEVFPEMEHGVLITGGEQFYIAQCPKCCTITSAESWNRLHGGTRIEVEVCNNKCLLLGAMSCSLTFHWDKFVVFKFTLAGKEFELGQSPPEDCPLRKKNQGPITISIKEVE